MKNHRDFAVSDSARLRFQVYELRQEIGQKDRALQHCRDFLNALCSLPNLDHVRELFDQAGWDWPKGPCSDEILRECQRQVTKAMETR